MFRRDDMFLCRLLTQLGPSMSALPADGLFTLAATWSNSSNRNSTARSSASASPDHVAQHQIDLAFTQVAVVRRALLQDRNGVDFT